MWVTQVLDADGTPHQLDGRLVRVVNAVIAHGAAINLADRGNIEVNWSDGETKVNTRTFYASEPEPRSRPKENHAAP